MALKLIIKINSRLKFLHRKKQLFNSSATQAIVIVLFNLTFIMHRQPRILTSPKKWKTEFKSLKLNTFGTVCSCNTSHKFWDRSPSPHYQCCLQVSKTVSWQKLRCCYSDNILQLWVEGRDLVYFCKVDHSRISINFSRNRLLLNNLCEILWQNLRKLDK